MLECKCKICGKYFFRKKSQIIYGGGKYCSDACRFVGRKNGKCVLCTTCGVEIYRSSRQLKKSKSGLYFCSKNCLLNWIYKKYNGHPNWKGGFHSYRPALLKEKIGSCVLCKEDDIRMLAVHHIDKNRKNRQ